jgi:hypothetical protein
MRFAALCAALAADVVRAQVVCDAVPATYECWNDYDPGTCIYVRPPAPAYARCASPSHAATLHSYSPR